MLPASTTGKHKYKQTRKLSLEELLAAAETATNTSDPQYALTLYTAALKKANNNNITVEILEKRAELYVSLSNVEAATVDYQQALDCLEQQQQQQQQHSTNEDLSADNVLHHKAALHMFLGQLKTGRSALECYQKGIHCLESHSTDSDNDDQQKQPLAEAYTAVAELYLTDLCMEDEAEALCEQHLSNALALCPDSPDVCQTLASLKFSQQQTTAAMESVWKVYQSMHVGCQALASLVGLRETSQQEHGATELLEVQDVQDLPGFEFRCVTAKLLLECTLHCHDKGDNEPTKEQFRTAAIDVLGSLLAENDQVVEIWVLVGDAFGESDTPSLARHYWCRALEMLHSVRENLLEEQRDAGDSIQEDEIQQQLNDVNCQMEDLQGKIDELPEEDAMEE